MKFEKCIRKKSYKIQYITYKNTTVYIYYKDLCITLEKCYEKWSDL